MKSVAAYRLCHIPCGPVLAQIVAWTILGVLGAVDGRDRGTCVITKKLHFNVAIFGITAHQFGRPIRECVELCPNHRMMSATNHCKPIVRMLIGIDIALVAQANTVQFVACKIHQPLSSGQSIHFR